MDSPKLIEITNDIINYIIKEDYKGYDPYDVLNSPIFRLPVLRSNKTIRFLAQQVFRRIPVNIRPLLGIKKDINPVTLGLCIQAYTYLSLIDAQKKDFYLKEIEKLVSKLVNLSSRGYSGYSWGYNFDWEARYAKINKFVPTVVATGIITNGLFEHYKYYPGRTIREILISSSKFILNDLNRTYEGDTFCFSYSPNDTQKVFNATMKGARLLAQVYSLTGDKSLLEEAEKTVKFVVNNQNADGSWYYSKGDARRWIDNFHTAYVLDALKAFIELTGKNEYKVYFEKGFEYYITNLFTNEGLPKYYSHSFYPVDSTALAQSIITLTGNSNVLMVDKIISFAIKALYRGNGIFYNGKQKYFIDRNIYIRWSLAWFLVAFSKYLLIV